MFTFLYIHNFIYNVKPMCLAACHQEKLCLTRENLRLMRMFWMLFASSTEKVQATTPITSRTGASLLCQRINGGRKIQNSNFSRIRMHKTYAQKLFKIFQRRNLLLNSYIRHMLLRYQILW